MEGKDDMLFKEYSIEWLDIFKSMKSYNTQRLYRNIIENHLIPEIGEMEMNNISISNLQQIINKRISNPATCKHILLTLKQIFKIAKEEGVVDKNLYTFIQAPYYESNEKRALTKEEKIAVRNIDCDSMSKVFVHILYGCGLRKGEALALTKNDIINNELVIDKSLHFVNGNAICGNPKTHSSNRKVPIPEFLLKELTSYMETIDDKLFFNIDGEYLKDSEYTKMWKYIVAKIDNNINANSKLTAHIFRHNYATTLYYSDVSIKQAAKLMGHSNVNTILKIYAHLDSENEKLTEKINKIFYI